MSSDTSKTAAAPMVVLRQHPGDRGRHFSYMMPAALGSLLFHAVLLALFFFLIPSSQAVTPTDVAQEAYNLGADTVPVEREMSLIEEFDPAIQEAGVDAIPEVDRKEKINVPGEVDPRQALGLIDGSKDKPPVTMLPTSGFGGSNQGSPLAGPSPAGVPSKMGEAGVYGPRNFTLQDNFSGRSGAAKEFALRSGNGTTASEAAVARGLKWLIRQQMPDGRWMLNGPNLPPRDRGTEANDVGATALGLLPLLAAGKTHKPSKDNPYDKNIDKALKFLMRQQDPRTGYFGVSMYGHGLAAIAMCEAYGLTQDSALRRSAQAGIHLIVASQHEGGGWRYGPTKQPGDLSVTGWQIMALKSAQMAGLDVDGLAMRRAVSFLDSCCSPEDSYGYVGPGDSHRMTAVGLLCRQHLQNWGPSHPRMIKSIAKHLTPNLPNRPDVYYCYYATQVMHHQGGEAWRNWNEVMREYLIKTQDQNQSSLGYGSWSAESDPFGRVGGRLMMTSLNLLTLEVYYRYLPLYYRDAGYKADATVKKSL